MTSRITRLEEALAALRDPSPTNPDEALETVERLAEGELSEDLETLLVDGVRVAFPQLTKRGVARALKLLASRATPKALDALNELLASAPGAVADLTYVFSDLLDEPEQALPLFPGLLHAMWNSRERSGAIELILRCADAEVLEPSEHPEFEQRALDRVQELLDRKRLELDRHAPGFDHLIDYETWEAIPTHMFEIYDELEFWLDLMRFFESPRAEALLRRSLGLRSRTLRAWAAGSLLARETEIEAPLLEELAAHRGSRWILFVILRDLGLSEAFPAEWRSEALLAEGAMVHYLQNPREWGSVPEEIEELDVCEAIDDAGRRGRLHLFRFRHSAWGEEWSAGAAGLFLGDDAGAWHPLHTQMAADRPGGRTPLELRAVFVDEEERLRS
jgi:hypothetical protein